MRCLRLLAFLLALCMSHGVIAAPNHDFSTFQSFVRITLPAKITWTETEFNKARGLQTLRLTKALNEAQRQELKAQLMATGEVRWVVIENDEVQIAYFDLRRKVLEVSEGVWALVVKRPTSFILADYLDSSDCQTWFNHLNESMQLLATSMCAAKGQTSVEAILRGDDEFAKRLIDELMGPSPNFSRFHSELETRPSLSQRSRQLLYFVEAIRLFSTNSELLALERLRLIASTSPNSELEGIVIDLGVSTYSRLLEAALVRGDAEQALKLYDVFKTWGKLEPHQELALILAQNLLAEDRTHEALDRVLVLLERDPTDFAALDLALTIYERLDLPYQAHLIRKRRKD